MDICDGFDWEDFLKKMAIKDDIHTMNEYGWVKAAYKNAEKNLLGSAVVVATLDGILKRNEPTEIRNWRSQIRLA